MPTNITQAGPEWLVIALMVAIVLKFIGQTLSEVSETWAKLLGPLGRRWRDCGIRRQEERAAEQTARMADLEDMTRERDTLATSLSNCRNESEIQHRYIEYDTQWHRDARLVAIEAGCNQLIDHKSYLQFRREAKQP